LAPGIIFLLIFKNNTSFFGKIVVEYYAVFIKERNIMNKKKSTVLRGVLIGLCVLLSLVLVLMIGAAVYIETRILGRVQKLDTDVTANSEQIESYLKETDAPDPNFTGPTFNGEDVTIPTGAAPVIETGENVINFLLVGQDRRSSGYVGQTDAMILVTVNKANKTLTLTSFMRDLWVRIPGKFNERLNTAYYLGGFDLLNATLKENFGIVVDHNIAIDFKAFSKAVDLLGGIDMELTQKEANYLNKKGNWDVNPSTAWAWNLTEGVNHLSGEQALAYSRIRGVGGAYGNDDFGRTGRQRAVLAKLVDKAKSMDVIKALSLVDQLIPLVATDMTSDQILSYVRELLPILSKLELVNQRVPAENTYYLAMIDGKSVIVADFEKNRQILQDAFSED